jgi:hypothetical protein
MTAEEGIPLLRIQEELIGPLGVVTQFDFAKPDETVRRTKVGDLIKRWRPSSGVKVDRRRFSTRYQLEKRRTHTRDNTSITHRTAPR